MPPALAARFTVSELAVLKIVSDEIRQHGTCFCTVAEIAARAGTSRTKVQDAIRQAARLGLLTVQERRREGQKNPPNVSGLPRMAAVASYRVQKNRPHGQQARKRRRRGFAAKGFQEGGWGEIAAARRRRGGETGMSEMTARRPQQLRSGDPMMTRKGCEYFPKTPGRGSRTFRMTRQQTLGLQPKLSRPEKDPTSCVQR